MNDNHGRWARGLLGILLLTLLAACSPGGSNAKSVPETPTSTNGPQAGITPEPVAPAAPEAPPPAPAAPAPVAPVVDPEPGPPALPGPSASAARKANYGHYFALRYSDSPADAAMLCSQPGVMGVVWRRTWFEVEPSPGQYDFDSFDRVLEAIAKSPNPGCQLWLFVEFKSFDNSPVKNPCPAHLRATHSGPNAHGNGASTCFMWEPVVTKAYVQMMRAAAQRYDGNPRVEGLVLQESALGFNGAYSQDVGDGGTYTAAAWRDALSTLVTECGAAFAQSRCLAFLNFIRGGQQYLEDVARAIRAVPDRRGCLSGPDLLPDSRSLYASDDSAYQVLVRHDGCRANSAQNDSYGVPDCGLECIFQFAVRGTFGSFDTSAPRDAGVCVNSYLMWNHLVVTSRTGLDWTRALPIIAAYPYGREWYEQCDGGGSPP